MSALHRCMILLSTMAWLEAPALALQDTRPARPPQFSSPEVLADRKIVFRVYAPKAETVQLQSGDIRGGPPMPLKKGEDGVWQITVDPVAPGAYRYLFQVDGVPVVDPRNPATSESNANSWSLVVVPGSEAFDVRDVPHGCVAQVTYYSKTLKRFRRAHVYTPPGYEKGENTFPVFYLLHGATDSDHSWSSVGRAGVILDNLIAAGKARPMIVVMPAGHTGPFRFGPPANRSFERQMDEFVEDFTKDLRPWIETQYRVAPGRANRAIAGLSMGGMQTLNIAFARLDDYGYVGVYSSGLFGIVSRPGGPPPNQQWEQRNKAALENASVKKGLQLLWFACGKEDFLFETNNATVALLRKYKFNVVSRETEGGHTWLNWRAYLHEFAPLLFKQS